MNKRRIRDANGHYLSEELTDREIDAWYAAAPHYRQVFNRWEVDRSVRREYDMRISMREFWVVYVSYDTDFDSKYVCNDLPDN